MRLRRLWQRRLLGQGRLDAVRLQVQWRWSMSRQSYYEELATGHLELARVYQHEGDVTMVRWSVARAKEAHQEGRSAARQGWMIREALQALSRSVPAVVAVG